MLSQVLKRYPQAAFFAIWIGCAAAGFGLPKAFAVVDFVEKWLADLRLTAIGEAMPQRDDIVLFTITEDTLAQYPYRFPLDRGMLADAVSRLDAAGAKAIGIDVLFDQATEPAKDRYLAETVARSTVPVIVGWASEAEELTPQQRKYLAEYLPEAIHAPSNLSKDARDGTVRWIYPGTQTETGYRPGFAPALARAAGVDPSRESESLYFRRGADDSLQPFRKFPLHMLPHLPAAWFKGKIVLIGADLPNEDRHRTPFASMVGNDRGSVPGVVVHAFALAQMLDGATLTATPVPFDVILMLVAAGAGVLIALLQAGVLVKIGAVLIAMATIWGGGFALFAFGGPLAPLFGPSVALAAAISLSAGHIAQLYKQKKQFAEAMVQRRNQSIQKMVENSFDGIVVTSSEGAILSTNGSADRILGWNEGEAVGLPIGEYVPGIEAAAARFLELDLSQREGGSLAVEPLEMDCTRRDGTAFAMEVIVYTARISFEKSAVVTVGGERVSYIYSFRDVTARREEKEARERALREAETASRAKTEFLANMSHELRTPLNAIIGFSELMKMQPFGPLGSPQYLDYIVDIHNSGSHLIEVVNDILDMSKIEAGELKPNEAVFAFDRVIDSATRMVADRAYKSEVVIEQDIAPNLPCLLADERMIKQILLNLLSNAVKFTPAEGRVMLSARADATGFTFSVSDTGIGIPADKLDIVMLPFGQADMTLHREYEGTGLGLPLVKGMTELHGGTFELASVEGEGTTATVWLPQDRIVPERKTA